MQYVSLIVFEETREDPDIYSIQFCMQGEDFDFVLKLLLNYSHPIHTQKVVVYKKAGQPFL